MASCPLRKCHVSVFPASIFWRSEMGKGDCMWVDVPSRFPCRAVRSFGGWLGSRRRMKLSGSLLGGEESLSWTLGRSRTSKIFVCSTVFFYCSRVCFVFLLRMRAMQCLLVLDLEFDCCYVLSMLFHQAGFNIFSFFSCFGRALPA